MSMKNGLPDNAADFTAVARAFSKQASLFDEIERENPIVLDLRRRIRNHVFSLVLPGESLLEINAGTGLDAVEFAQRGIYVTATDIADGMIEQMRRKVELNSLQEFMRVQQCSFTALESLPEYSPKTLKKETAIARSSHGQFDHIFSNFGGLNCTGNLETVINTLIPILRPGGTVTLVIMPPLCLWEMFSILRGNTSAFRRLGRNGTVAHLEGEYFRVHYYTPGFVERAFGRDFTRISLTGLASISPPPHAENFAKHFPRIYNVLARIDERLAHFPFFRSCADHFCLSLKKSDT